jgi:hypothetical protein
MSLINDVREGNGRSSVYLIYSKSKYVVLTHWLVFRPCSQCAMFLTRSLRSSFHKQVAALLLSKQQYEDGCILGCSAVQIGISLPTFPEVNHKNDRPDDGGNTGLWNAEELLPVYTVPQPRIQPSSYSPPWESEILLSNSSSQPQDGYYNALNTQPAYCSVARTYQPRSNALPLFPSKSKPVWYRSTASHV